MKAGLLTGRPSSLNTASHGTNRFPLAAPAILPMLNKPNRRIYAGNPREPVAAEQPDV